MNFCFLVLSLFYISDLVAFLCLLENSILFPETFFCDSEHILVTESYHCHERPLHYRKAGDE